MMTLRERLRPKLTLLAFTCAVACTEEAPGRYAGDDASGVTLRGRVSIGGPLWKARVSLFELEADGWTELGSATTGPGGEFQLTATLGELPLRLVASGTDAEYTDALGKTCRPDAGFSLRTDLADGKSAGEGLVVIDPWTDLASRLAESKGAAAELGAADWVANLLFFSGLLASHLDRDRPPELSRVDGFDPSQEPLPWPNPSSRLGIVNAGLSWLAQKVWDREAGGRCTHELLEALQADASDGIFDGQGIGDQARASDGAVSAETLRWALAFSVDAWVTSDRNRSGVTRAMLGQKSGLYEQLSTNSGPLFPSDPKPQLFDPIDPELWFLPEAPAGGACLSADFELGIGAQDEHKLAKLEYEAPCEVREESSAGGVTLAVSVGTGPEDCLGALHFVFRALDAAGNTAEVTRDVVADIETPTLSLDRGTLGSCPDTWPEMLALLEAPDPCPVIQLTCQGRHCEKQDAGWGCPAPEGNPAVATLQYLDAAGNTATLELERCPDLDGPAISLLQPENSYYGPARPLCRVRVEDRSGIEVLEVYGPEGEELAFEQVPEGGATVLVIALPQEAQAWKLAIFALDTRGNSTSAEFPLIFDGQAPVLTGTDSPLPVPEGPLVLDLPCSDATSGIAEVGMTGPEGWTFSANKNSCRLQGQVEIDTPEVAVGVFLADAAGNRTDAVITLYPDAVEPSVELLPTFFRNEDKVLEIEELGVHSLQASGQMLELSEETCSIQGCPHFVKRAPLIFWNEQNPAASNAVIFRFRAADSDNGGHEKVPGLAWFKASFKRKGKTLYETSPQSLAAPVELALPFAYPQLFDAGGAEPSFAEELTPDLLLAEAGDLVGNTTFRAYPLFVEMQPAPLRASELQKSEADGLPALEDVLALPLSGDFPDKAAAGQFSIENPYPVSATVAFQAYSSKGLCLVETARSYTTLYSNPRGQGCGDGKCRYCSQGEVEVVHAGTCTAPEQYSDKTWAETRTAPTFTWSKAGGASGNLAELPATIGPQETLTVLVTVDTSCLPAVTGPVSYYVGAGMPQKQLYPLDETGLYAVCVSKTGTTPYYAYDVRRKLRSITVQTEDMMGLLQLQARALDAPGGPPLPGLVRWDRTLSFDAGPALPPY